MLSSILRSKRAIAVNIEIMRAFETASALERLQPLELLELLEQLERLEPRLLGWLTGAERNGWNGIFPKSGCQKKLFGVT